MYEEKIVKIKKDETKNKAIFDDVLAQLDKIYKQFGLIAEVHSKIDGDNVSFSLHLIDRPATSVHITKIFHSDGQIEDWKAIDLTDHLPPA